MKIFSVILVSVVTGVVVAVVVLMGAVTRGTETAAQEPPVVLGPDTVVVQAGLPGTLRLVDAPARSGPAARCGWYRLDVGEAAVLGVAAVRPSVGATYVLWCVHAASGATLAGYPTVAVYDPLAPLPGSAVSSYDAALYALARIRFDAPVAELSPAADQVVGVPTWLAVEGTLGAFGGWAGVLSPGGRGFGVVPGSSAGVSQPSRASVLSPAMIHLFAFPSTASSARRGADVIAYTVFACLGR